MDDLIRRMEFRPFSFETDPEFVVDMFRSLEILEGSWFDDEDTCRMYQKMVVRAKGSAWIVAIGKAIVAYADMSETATGCGFVQKMRIHGDYRHPKVVRKLLTGLKEEAKKRSWKSLTFVPDNDEQLRNLESIGLKRDRQYKWVFVADDGSETIEPVAIEKDMNAMLATPLMTYLGSPLPPSFILARAFMASDYGVFHFRRPRLFMLPAPGADYVACFDGREWFVFRHAKQTVDGDNVKMVLGTLGKVHEGRILLTQQAIEKADQTAASDEEFWDVFVDGIQ